jgi:hypothetical protein
VTPHKAAVPAESEKQFQGVVEKLAHGFGWLTFHPWISVRSAQGWPDLFMCRMGRAIAAELKSERGKLTVDQQVWLGVLKDCGIETYVWRPSQKAEILAVLR